MFIQNVNPSYVVMTGVRFRHEGCHQRSSLRDRTDINTVETEFNV